MDLQVQNTQNKIYNSVRRTYIDNSDLKEGESICRKCKGTGEINSKESVIGYDFPDVCSKCGGRGIVDWVTQVVERPPVITGSHSTSSSSGARVRGKSGIVKHPIPPKTHIIKGIFKGKKVTNYKRRKVV